MNTSFDNIADSYDEELKKSLGIFGNKNVSMFAKYKIKILKSKLSQVPTNILEFGCGTGRNCIFIKNIFPNSNIFGCDISEKSLEIARKINLTIHYNMITNPFDLSKAYKEPFDCIFISNVFHHIPINEHQFWLDALYGILSNKGFIIIFEHNPYNPITKYIFNTSKIDKDATMLNPSYCCSLLKKANFIDLRRDYTLFFLWRNGFFETIERILSWLPLGTQYYVIGRKCHDNVERL